MVLALAGFRRSRVRSLDPSRVERSTRDSLVCIVTAIDADRVVAKVVMQCGPHPVVSLMSTEAINELALTPGILADALIKSTNVLVETPANPLRSAK
jgi:molybdopterin-binding protein